MTLMSGYCGYYREEGYSVLEWWDYHEPPVVVATHYHHCNINGEFVLIFRELLTGRLLHLSHFSPI
jgi:hypothetical protein